MKSFCASIAVISVLLASGLATAAQQGAAQPASAPTLVRLDGQLRTPTGDARTGNVTIVVSLYAEKDDATPLWVEQQVVTLDATGRYTIFAGATLPDGVPQEFLSSSTPGRWLGVGEQGEAEQFRMMLVTVPYAAKAREADTLAGKSATDFVLSENLGATVKAALKADLVKGANANGTAPGTLAQNINFVQKWNGTAETDSLIFDNGTNVGIGTQAPVLPLTVVGANPSGAMGAYTSNVGRGISFNPSVTAGTVDIYADYLGGAEPKLHLSTYGNRAGAGGITIDTAGKVGIGTPAPLLNFMVVGNSPAGALGAYTSIAGRGIAFNPSLTAGVVDIYADYLGGTEPKLHLSTYANRFGANGLTVDTAGNVGIGMTTPSQKLDVAGNINVSGNINAKYQDVAEWVETSAPIEAGTVVIIDPLNPNRVLTAPGAYDTRVAGAVSKQPGLILGERSDTKAMVAQSGRVRIKADAKYGAIKIGDLLVTSPTPGYAMRSKPMKVGGQSMHRPGTLLGKALEALPNGQGEILVLLTLQ